jgi:transcriptional regulator with XRE-family HTH domain
MMNLNELKRSTPHPLRPVFSGYSRARIAEALGIHAAYLGNVLCGNMKPSADLESRMQTLAEEIRRAEAE